MPWQLMPIRIWFSFNRCASSDYADLAAAVRAIQDHAQGLPFQRTFQFSADDGGNAQIAVTLVRSAPTGFSLSL